MLLSVLGWIWVACGVFALWRPERWRRYLKTQPIDHLKSMGMWMEFILGVLLMKATWRMPGFLPQLLFLCGILGIFKVVFLWKAKSANGLITWFLNQPVKSFRWFAVSKIAFGAMLLSL
jgi:hypothetical protein